MSNNRNFKLKSYDEIFNVFNIKNSFDEGTKQIEINKLMNFENHPFKIIENSEMDELMESIQERGILMPILVRPKNDEYEIISGHRRKYCAEKIGIKEVPCIIQDLDNDEAILAMIESNIQRQNILPSEKAFSYKLRLEAISRQGKRTDLELRDNLSQSSRADDLIGEIYKESGRTVQRYIRLTELTEFFLDAVDKKSISFGAGIEISYLEKKEMEILENLIKENNIYPNSVQAKQMKNKTGVLNEEAIKNILFEEKTLPKKKNSINFDESKIRKFFPVHFTAKDIEKEILKILEEKYI